MNILQLLEIDMFVLCILTLALVVEICILVQIKKTHKTSIFKSLV